MADDTARNAGWMESIRVYFTPKLLAMFMLGFAAGLPFLLYFSTLSFWLERSGIETAVIAYFSWFGLSYSLKFLWAPWLDKFAPPGFGALLGLRRGWILVAQIGIFAGLVGMGFSDPAANLSQIALFSFLTVFASSIQDISIDAWRIEIAKDEDEQAPLSAMYQAGYRIGMIVAGGGSLFLAGLFSFHVAYVVMGVLIFIGAIGGLWAGEPGAQGRPINTENLVRNLVVGVVFSLVALLAVMALMVLAGRGMPVILSAMGIEMTRGLIRNAVLYIIAAPFVTLAILVPFIRQLPKTSRWLKNPATGPFVDFFWRYGFPAIIVLAFISTFRLSDIVMGVMAVPLYSSMGFAEETVGLIKGTMGPIILIIGAFLGGAGALKYGLPRMLFVGAVISVFGNAIFAWLAAQSEPQAWHLAVAILADNLAGGFAGTVFIAYMSGLTNRAFTAAQYALFSSLFMLLPKLVAGLSGQIVEAQGYVMFFLIAAAMGLPAIILTPLATRTKADRSIDPPAETATPKA
jgi:PAT family beta-lactamase induction signal transducer AmpG